jgi:hypothetical protein
MYEYDVVLASDFDDFVADVNERLANGWKCQGGLTATYDSKYNIEWWYQAVIRETKEQSNEQSNEMD